MWWAGHKSVCLSLSIAVLNVFMPSQTFNSKMEKNFIKTDKKMKKIFPTNMSFIGEPPVTPSSPSASKEGASKASIQKMSIRKDTFDSHLTDHARYVLRGQINPTILLQLITQVANLGNAKYTTVQKFVNLKLTWLLTLWLNKKLAEAFSVKVLQN